MSEDTEIEPRTIATWHWQSDALTTRLDLIHIFYNCVTELQLCIHFRAWLSFGFLQKVKIVVPCSTLKAVGIKTECDEKGVLESYVN